METNKLYRIAEKSGIAVDRFPLPNNHSIAIKDGDNMYVAIDENISGAQERVCLAHELGHCETASFYNIYAPLDIREKHEHRADRWAIRALVPKTVYQRALRHGYDNIYALAEFFGVTADFMKKAVEYYQKA